MTKSEGKRVYKAPQMTAVSFQMERGFDTSTLNLWQPVENGDHDRHVEDYSVANGWQSGSNGFWN